MANPKETFFEDIMTPHRIMGLCDAVFAIVMTLLILDVKLPTAKQKVNDEQLLALLQTHVPDLMAFVFSFIIIGAFWIAHHTHFHYIEKSNQTLLWINVVLLMIVVLIPLTTAMVGDYYGHRLSGIFFTSNLLLVELMMHLNWVYAKATGLVSSKADGVVRVKYQSWLGIINIIIFLLAVVFSFIDIHICYALYISIPIIHAIFLKKWIRSDAKARK